MYDVSASSQLFNLRVIPWWTDGCSTFLNNIFKWLPRLLNRNLNIIEFGGGNSTFYLIGKGNKVLTVESDSGYIELLSHIASDMGRKVAVIEVDEFNIDMFVEFDLLLIKANDLIGTREILVNHRWDIIINDGISRREVVESITENELKAIIILDNAEYCANWGRLDRGSAKPDLIQVYRSILRDRDWRNYVFEQAEGRDGRGAVDKTGWESPHRWASAVIWPHDHLLTKLMVSNIGLPLVNEMGLDDLDIVTLGERCPFDWEKMEWLKPHFPPELDLKLNRAYE